VHSLCSSPALEPWVRDLLSGNSDLKKWNLGDHWSCVMLAVVLWVCQCQIWGIWGLLWKHNWNMLQPLERPETNNLFPMDYHITNIKSTRPCTCLRAFTIFRSCSAKSEKLRNMTSKCALFLRLISASQENAWHAHVQAYSNDSLSESSFDALTWACEMNPTLISSTLVKAQKHHCAAKSEHAKKKNITFMTYLF
jgi:hypothetical protein